MAKGHGGRPRIEDGEKPTRQIRVFKELADMIGEIIDLEGGSVANLVDDWLRPHVKSHYEALKPHIEQMKRTRSAARKSAPEKKG